MKLLHTGDLHLGKNLHETSLLEDQKCMLDHLKYELGKDDYAALLIAGDVYDRSIPNAEAVELFSSFLVQLHTEYPDLLVCIIPGNHDSAQRLSYADQILQQQNIHIICNPEQSFTPIIAIKNNERLALFLLPFLATGTLQSPQKEHTLELDFLLTEPPLLVSQAELAAEAARRFDTILSKPELNTIPAVLVAHLFTLAGKESESERHFLGSAEQVRPSLFSRFNYVALGHLHRTQRITDRMYYAGSPLAYAFDEAGIEKVFLKVDIDCTSPSFPVTVTPLPVHPLRTVVRLSGSFADFYTGTVFDAHSQEYIEISLTDDTLIANPMNLLRQKFPYLLSLKQGETIDTKDRVNGSIPEKTVNLGEKRNPVSDFCRFQEMLYGTVEPEKKALFASLLSECTDAP